MAKRGSTKALSVEQEEFIAEIYGGQRSASSGASDTDAGDVRTALQLIECKLTGHPGGDHKGSMVQTHLEKVAAEAWAEGREPALCLRYWNPNSILASRDGWVDLVVRTVSDDSAVRHD